MSQVLGNTAGLKKKEIHLLDKLSQRSVDPDQFVSPTLAEDVCALSLLLKRELTLLVDRQGRVYQVYVGSLAMLGEEDRVEIPYKAGGLCDIRVVTTQLERMNPPQKDVLTSLLQYRFDAVTTLVATPSPEWSLQFGEHPRACDAIFISSLKRAEGEGQLDVETEGPFTLHKTAERSVEDFLAIIESQFDNRWLTLMKAQSKEERAFLVGLAEQGPQGKHRAEDLMDELSLLTKTAGGTVVGRVIQSRPMPDPQYYIGKGKAHELAYEMQQQGINLVICDDELSPAQQRNLERVLRTRVIDRTQLILDIFAQRAQSWEGKIQVELAQLQYLLPRLSGTGFRFSQQSSGAKGGGIATRGPGETKLEMDRRRLRGRVTDLERQAESVKKNRQLQRKSRQENDMPVVALVGYTNAGKSTLMNTLTKAGVLTEDKLFATLDPITRRLIRPGMPPCLLIDTVGFIQKLPTTLVKAFRSTLEEIQSATLILHVMDISHPDREAHFRAVETTLADLDCGEKPQWVLLNKTDRVKQPEKETAAMESLLAEVTHYEVSAVTEAGLPEFLEGLGEFLRTLSPALSSSESY